MIRLGGSLDDVLTRLLAGMPWTAEVSQVPSARRVSWPYAIPLDASALVWPGAIPSRIARRSEVI